MTGVLVVFVVPALGGITAGYVAISMSHVCLKLIYLLACVYLFTLADRQSRHTRQLYSVGAVGLLEFADGHLPLLPPCPAPPRARKSHL